MTRRHVNLEYRNVYLELHNDQIYYVNIDFHHYYGISAIESPTVCLCETFIGVKRREEKRMFSQAVDEWEMKRRYTNAKAASALVLSFVLSAWKWT